MRCEACGHLYDGRLRLCPECHEDNPTYSRPQSTRAESQGPAPVVTKQAALTASATQAVSRKPATRTNPGRRIPTKDPQPEKQAPVPGPAAAAPVRTAVCHICHERFDLGEFRQHLTLAHASPSPSTESPPALPPPTPGRSRSTFQSGKSAPAKSVIACPHCGRKVRQGNLKSHLRKVHPAELDLIDLDEESINRQLARFVQDPVMLSLFDSATIGERRQVLRQTTRTFRSHRRAVAQFAEDPRADPLLRARALTMLQAIGAAFRSGLFTDKQRRHQHRRPAEAERYRDLVVSGGLPGSGKRS